MSNRFSILAIFFFLVASFGRLEADEPAGWSLVRILVPDAATLATLWETGLDPEGSSGKPGGWMEFVAGPDERRALVARGIAFEVTTPDLAAAAARDLHPGPMDALGFGTGSMGGYYTLDEVGAQLDSMRSLYPGLISEKQEFNYSVEGRPLWVVRISDNPDTDEPSEPEVLYTALTHAREPAGMMSVVYYMWWLLEHYDSDPRARYLVDNRQIWFMPVVNPDGYRYNQSTNPSGGGLWRKNRRDNGNGTRGVDLNRNYGPEEMWNAPNSGSSTNPGSDTYRGTGPFSEPETQTVDSFMRLHSIRTCLNYHTYSRMLVYPWGCYESETTDSLFFREFAFELTRHNRYVSGTDLQTVNYSTRGNSDDYMYGDTTKFRTFAMTPEVGSSFWPASDQILPLAQENLEANLRASFFGGAMPVVHDLFPAPGSDTAGILPGAPFSVLLTVRNAGLEPAHSVAVSFTGAPGGLTFPGPPVVIGLLPPRSDTTIIVAGAVADTAVSGTVIRLPVRLTDSAGYDRTDTMMLCTGEPSRLFSDGAEEGTGAWETGGNWGIAADAHGGSASFHDSPAGATPAWSTAGIQTAVPVNLAGYSAATLAFWTRWAIEPSYDFGVVKVSADSGASWSVLRGSLANPASGSGTQSPGSFGYDAYTPGLDWVRQEIDLSAFAGGRVLLRFELDSDGSDSRDGWYLDDIRVTGYRAPVPGGSLTLTSVGHAVADLVFGEWPGAGDGIDPWIGETELGAPPPPGVFDARWIIPGTNGVSTDIRDTLSSAGDTNTFTMAISAVPSDYPVTLRWDRADFGAGAWTLTDTLGGGPSLVADMWKEERAVITDPSIGAVRITHTREASVGIRVDNRWGLVSIPVDPADPSVTALFPHAGPHVYAFSGGYQSESGLVPGTGYWILNDGVDSLAMTGVPFDRNVVPGDGLAWRLFGSVYCPIPRASACPACGQPPIVFGYRNGYYIPDTLVPGEAYWYHGDRPLELDCRTSGSPPGPSGARPVAEGTGMLTFSRGGTGGASIYFGIGGAERPNPGRFRLPPIPPDGGLDARFESENAVEYFEESGTPLGIRISGDGSGLTAAYRGDASIEGRFSLEVSVGGTAVAHSLADGATVSIPEGADIRLVPAGHAAVPGEFRVLGNYPNPFNPRTSISFDLPWAAKVSFLVRNVAGQEVGSPLPERDYPAGRQVLEYHADGLPSGVYFYSLRARPADGGTAGQFNGTFILIR